MGDIDEIEHTADRAIRVRGADAPALFAAAARGLCALASDPDLVPRSEEFDLDLQAVDLETLLVDFLNELVYRGETTGCVFPEVAIETLEAGARPRLRARVRGGRPAAAALAVKAATFAGLRIEATPRGLEATIVFDV